MYKQYVQMIPICSIKYIHKGKSTEQHKEEFALRVRTVVTRREIATLVRMGYGRKVLFFT